MLIALVANLALSLAAGADRIGFPIPAPRRVLICQFELPVPQFVSRLALMRRALGAAADQNLLVDTRAVGHMLSAAQGLNHFVSATRAAAAEIIVLDPLYSTHDQDENDTRAMAALCQSLLRLRDASGAALVVVHHIMSANRSAVTRSVALSAAPALCMRWTTVIYCSRGLLPSSPPSSCVSSSAMPPRSLRDCFSWIPGLCVLLRRAAATAPRRKVEKANVQQALADMGDQARYNQLRDQIMNTTECSKRTAQLAISEALPAGCNRADKRPIPPAVVDPVASATVIDCPRGVAPERMPKADATGLALEEIG